MYMGREFFGSVKKEDRAHDSRYAMLDGSW